MTNKLWIKREKWSSFNAEIIDKIQTNKYQNLYYYSTKCRIMSNISTYNVEKIELRLNVNCHQLMCQFELFVFEFLRTQIFNLCYFRIHFLINCLYLILNFVILWVEHWININMSFDEIKCHFVTIRLKYLKSSFVITKYQRFRENEIKTCLIYKHIFKTCERSFCCNFSTILFIQTFCKWHTNNFEYMYIYFNLL